MTRLPAYRVYLIIGACSALFFTLMFIAMTVYRVQVVGMTPFQLVMVGTVLEITCFTFEVPTGIVADMYSRRLSVVIGFVLIGAGYALEGLIPAVAVSLAAQVIAGIGYTFISGATEAWITDEVGQEKAGQAFLRSAQIGSLVGIGATLLGAGLASIRLNVPIVLGSVGTIWLGLFLALTMTEHGFTPAPPSERATWRRMGDTFREGLKVVRGSRLLITIMVIAVLFGAFSESLDRLADAHMLTNFTFPAVGNLAPVMWLALISLCARLINLGITEVVRRRVDTSSHSGVAGALLALHWLLIAGMMIFALAGNFAVAVGGLWIISVARHNSDPLKNAWLNQNVGSRLRATVFSMVSQADAVGQMAGGPLIGAIGNMSLRLAMMAGGIILIPALVLYRRSLRYPVVDQVVDAEVSEA